jgi:hypothetical protein
MRQKSPGVVSSRKRPDERRLTNFLKEHAVAPAVADGRGYRRYSPEDDGPVREAFEDYSTGQRAFMTRMAHQGDASGIVFEHHPVPGCPLIPAQVRPDSEVRTVQASQEWHYHPTILTDTTPVYPREAGAGLAGRPLPPSQIHTADSMAAHIAKEAKNETDDAHGGVNVETVHRHCKGAKYFFLPSPKKIVSWRDNHERRFAARPEERRVHEKKEHGGALVRGDHFHDRTVKDKDNSPARRLDVHPQSLPLFDSAERVFFVIEGAIKADAVLSRGEAVFSVPSVTPVGSPGTGGLREAIPRRQDRRDRPRRRLVQQRRRLRAGAPRSVVPPHCGGRPRVCRCSSHQFRSERGR